MLNFFKYTNKILIFWYILKNIRELFKFIFKLLIVLLFLVPTKF